MPDPVLVNWRAQVLEHATRRRLPAVYAQPEWVRERGLISYSSDVEDMFRRAATRVDKTVKGARPGDLPIEQPTTFELVINRKTARTLGLTIPQSLLLRADRVIE